MQAVASPSEALAQRDAGLRQVVARDEGVGRPRLRECGPAITASPSAASPMVPLTATRSPGLAVERRSSWPVATLPKAVSDKVSGPGRRRGVAAHAGRCRIPADPRARPGGKAGEPGFIDGRGEGSRS